MLCEMVSGTCILLLSHLKGVQLQLRGWRLAPGCPVCSGGQSSTRQLFLCTTKNCQVEEQRGVRSIMSQCMLMKVFTRPVGGLASVPVLAATA